jgi:putative two-component system hydrogenase maturation factor HypX/HoxX
VWARRGVLLNPHYKGMGNLYGSEYWTYLLPRRVAPDAARTLMDSRLPVGAAQAAALGLVDASFGTEPAAFQAEVAARARALADDPDFDRLLQVRNERRAADEAAKPLAAYRAEELERMKLNFYGFDPSYHVARHAFVAKVPRSRTPLWLAGHRAERKGPR